jgi:hypothetical protein
MSQRLTGSSLFDHLSVTVPEDTVQVGPENRAEETRTRQLCLSLRTLETEMDRQVPWRYQWITIRRPVTKNMWQFSRDSQK